MPLAPEMSKLERNGLSNLDHNRFSERSQALVEHEPRLVECEVFGNFTEPKSVRPGIQTINPGTVAIGSSMFISKNKSRTKTREKHSARQCFPTPLPARVKPMIKIGTRRKGSWCFPVCKNNSTRCVAANVWCLGNSFACFGWLIWSHFARQISQSLLKHVHFHARYVRRAACSNFKISKQSCLLAPSEKSGAKPAAKSANLWDTEKQVGLVPFSWDFSWYTTGIFHLLGDRSCFTLLGISSWEGKGLKKGLNGEWLLRYTGLYVHVTLDYPRSSRI